VSERAPPHTSKNTPHTLPARGGRSEGWTEASR
jgi:hypothetical protein